MSWQNIAAQATLCNFGTTGAAFAASAAWASAYTGQIWGTVGFASVSAALAAASAANGCYSTPPTEPPSSIRICCMRWSNSTATLYYEENGYAEFGSNFPQNVKNIISIERGGEPPVSPPNGYVPVTITFDRGNNIPITQVGSCPPDWLNNPDGCLTLGLGGPGSSCVGQGPEPTPIFPDPPDPIPVPDPDTGCTWNVTMADAYLNERGNLVVLYKATSNDPDTCGPPQYWWDETGKEPTPVSPQPGPDSNPDSPVPPPEPLPCCDDIKDLLEEIKECACSSDEQPLEGDYRTITFISDENSPEGKSRLSKRFRYRSSSGVGLSGVVEHWRSFTWAAGPVCVSHKGSTLGSPQVWAATAEEGKRVIRHAAGEAGVDADQVGRWLVSGSTDPRYGMPGTMRVNTKGGFYWITSRLGPDQRPLVQES